MSPPRAQAALEFLTTYGWAFIIILASIAALAYFGVLDPSKFIPDRCLFGSEFECLDFSLVNKADPNNGNILTSFVEFALINSVGETIDITQYKCLFPKDVEMSCACAACACPVECPPEVCMPDHPQFDQYEIPKDWVSGTNQTMLCKWQADQSGMVAGDKAKVRVELVYTIRSTGYPHTVDGEVISTVSG